MAEEQETLLTSVVGGDALDKARDHTGMKDEDSVIEDGAEKLGAEQEEGDVDVEDQESMDHEETMDVVDELGHSEIDEDTLEDDAESEDNNSIEGKEDVAGEEGESDREHLDDEDAEDAEGTADVTPASDDKHAVKKGKSEVFIFFDTCKQELSTLTSPFNLGCGWRGFPLFCDATQTNCLLMFGCGMFLFGVTCPGVESS